MASLAGQIRLPPASQPNRPASHPQCLKLANNQSFASFHRFINSWCSCYSAACCWSPSKLLLYDGSLKCAVKAIPLGSGNELPQGERARRQRAAAYAWYVDRAGRKEFYVGP
jgi:hypothetical protein